MNPSLIRWPAHLLEPRGPVVKMGSAQNFPFAARSIYLWTVDAAKYRAIFFTTDGKPGQELNLRPLFVAYHGEVSG